MPALTRRLQAAIERLVHLHEGELKPLVLAFVYFFCLLSAYYVLRPVRDTMGIAGGVENLQWLFTGTFTVMLCAVPVFGWAVARFPRRRLIPVVYGFFIVNLLLFAAAFRVPGIEVHVARVFFVWLSVFNLFVVSVFWSFMADIFTPAQGKRLFGAIAAGGTAGAMAGPALTAALAAALGPGGLLLVSAALLGCALACVRPLARHRFRESPHEEPAAVGGSIIAGATTFFRSPYLAGIGLYILLYTWTSTFLYFQQAEIVADAFADDGRRTQVFALIDLGTNALTLVLQLFVTGRVLSLAGTRSGLVILPVLTAVGFVALAAGPVLATLVVFQIARRAGNYALARPSREVLFTVVPREQKYKSKNFIDTVVYRGGDAASGWLYAALAALGLELGGLALVAAAIAGGWLAVGWALGAQEARRERTQPEAAE